MYNTLPYRTVYDQLIDNAVVKIFTSSMALANPKCGVLPKVKTQTQNKKSSLVPATSIEEIIQYHTQSITNSVNVPYHVIYEDVTSVYKSMILFNTNIM